MIQFLQGFFQSVAEFFTKIWSVITFAIDEVAQLFRVVKMAVQFTTNALGTLPSIFIGFGIAMLLVLIIYVIIGRNAGGD